MPEYYRLPTYIGNALLALLGFAVLFQQAPGGIVGPFIVALAGLNLYLIRRLDLYSREENWLAMDVVKAKLREELSEVESHQAHPTIADVATPLSLALGGDARPDVPKSPPETKS